MPITQFVHVSIGVSDPEKSVPFYRDILGFKLIATLHYDKPGPAKVMGFKEANFTVWLMMRDGFRLELIHFIHPKSEPLRDRPRTNALGLSHLTVGIQDPGKDYGRAQGARGQGLGAYGGQFRGRCPRLYVPVRRPRRLSDRML